MASSCLGLPPLQAPHLRHLALIAFVLPITSRLLTATMDLVTLALEVTDRSTRCHPNGLVLAFIHSPVAAAGDALDHCIFLYTVFNYDVERRLTHTPIMTPVTLPNLRWFGFLGGSMFIEELIHRITTPHLEKLDLDSFKYPTISIPSLLQFMNTLEHLKFDSAKFEFFKYRVHPMFRPHRDAKLHALFISVDWWYFDWQVSSVAQILNSPCEKFSAMEYVILEHRNIMWSVEVYMEIEHEWCKLFRTFSNLKTLCVDDEFVEELSRCLLVDDEGHPLEPLPELAFSQAGSDNDRDVFISLIDTLQNTGRPVTPIRL
ncbi:hypothetical protein V8E52_008722 [Russula decolorans]|jgi:hypothetical protein